MQLRGKAAPFGVAGGGSAALNRFTWQTDKGEATPPMASKISDLHLQAGRRVRLETPGGGGWGPPAQRPVDAVAHDLALGFVSTAQARDIYGVAVDADGKVDSARTDALRQGDAA